LENENKNIELIFGDGNKSIFKAEEFDFV